MNRDEEEYGPARLLEHFIRPDACVEGLIEEVQRFGPDQSTPMTQPQYLSETDDIDARTLASAGHLAT